ncbi:MAG TPA: hypothetical protein VL359_02585, partial [bacterium]|nr:hypothetical protein [bacterium]
MTASKELFRALEFAHYAERFRDKVFIVALSRDARFHDLLHDLKVLAGYRIQVVLIATDPDGQLDRVIGLSNQRGTRFHLSLLTEVAFQPGQGPPAIDFSRIQASLARGMMPVIAVHLEPSPPPLRAVAGGTPALPTLAPMPAPVEPSFALAGELALHLHADKLYLVTPQVGPWLGVVSRTQVLLEEISRLDAELSNGGLSGQECLLQTVHQYLKRGIPDVVVVEGRPSYLFKE